MAQETITVDEMEYIVVKTADYDQIEAQLAECREKLDQEREWIDTLLEDEMISRAGSHDSRDKEVTQVLYELRMSISRREVAALSSVQAALEQARAERSQHVARAREWIRRARRWFTPKIREQSSAAATVWKYLNEALEELAQAEDSDG